MGWKRKTSFLLVGIPLLIFIVSAAFYFFLPAYLNSGPFSETLRQAGLEELSWEVRNIGATGADIASVRLGSENEPGFSADVVRLDYTPGGLTDKHVKRIFISGVEFHCAYREGEFSVRGIDPEQFVSKTPAEAEPSDASFDLSLPFSFDSLIIRNAVVYFTWQDGLTYRIPLQARISLENQRSRPVLVGKIHLIPRNQRIDLALHVDAGKKTLRLQVTAEQLHPERFGDLIGKVPGLTLAGELSLSAEGEFRSAPFEIASARASLEFRNTGSVYQGYKLQTAGEEGNTSPLHLGVHTAEGREWQVTASGFDLVSPVPLGITDLKARVKQESGGVSTSGDLLFLVGKSEREKDLSVQVTDPLLLPLGFSGRYGPESGWEFTLENVPSDVNLSKGWGVQIGERTIQTEPPDLEIAGRGGLKGGKIDYELTLPSPVVAGDIALKGTALSIKGDIRFDKTGPLKGSTEFTAAETAVQLSETAIEIPILGVSGEWNTTEAGTLHFDGAVSMDEGRIHDAGSDTRITGIRANMPVHWPWKSSRTQGEFSAAGIRMSDFQLGGVKGTIQPDREGVAFTGVFSVRPLPGASIAVEGSTHFLFGANRTEVRFDGGYSAAASPMRLSTLLPNVKGMTVNGNLKLTGTLTSDSTGLSSSAVMSLDNGHFWMKDSDLAAENIQLELVLPDLLNLRSGPAQVLTVETISLGKIHMNDLRVQFQVESGESVLVEKAGFQWCGGRVNAQALRVLPGVDDYDVTLYCDRLNLADLLEQFGAAQAAGEGAVNGRIPVRYSGGKILFDDGFLYSTPGAGGTIQVTGAEMLTSGMPEGTSQYGQIDLAREALKNYEYDWVRIRMETEGEMLILDLQFDGQPVDPLPFVYQEEAGGFVRMEAGGQVSRFQGIRLNVNLEVPLNKILRFKGIWDMLQ